ncbi:LPXTG cell wall anchor domain-containing protein [Glutamicibacter sp. HZAU]|nr:LPXTG cell wall anchor domain-containing protein [Glutamicibacter sp. HZAU]
MTGAQGTMLFSIAGVGLMGVAAGGALLQRRRARQGN